VFRGFPRLGRFWKENVGALVSPLVIPMPATAAVPGQQLRYVGFGVHPILSNPLKYSFPKILYHDVEFLI
jgi:hypothetical protein